MSAQLNFFSAKAPSTAAAVGNAFLRLGREDPGGPPIDQMKMQKLLFYAHAWHLAINNSALFDEDIEAWPWGPVVRDIYAQTIKFGRGPITQELTEIGATSPNNLDFNFVVPTPPSKDIMDFLRSVWISHKGLTGVQLSNSTHAPGEPWTIIKERYGTLETKPRIPNELIMAVFKKKLERAAAGHSVT